MSLKLMTEIGDLKVGDKVNLERALAAHVRFGGHFVQVRPTLPAERYVKLK